MLVSALSAGVAGPRGFETTIENWLAGVSSVRANGDRRAGFAGQCAKAQIFAINATAEKNRVAGLNETAAEHGANGFLGGSER